MAFYNPHELLYHSLSFGSLHQTHSVYPNTQFMYLYFYFGFSQGLITTLSEFSKIEPEKGWIGWGFDVLVQKPVSWGFSTLQTFLNWKNNKDESFVVISVVKVWILYYLNNCILMFSNILHSIAIKCRFSPSQINMIQNILI